MKFCDPHWVALKKAIDDRGLGHLNSKSGEEAVARLLDQVDGPKKQTYDPLMSAHNMITANAIHAGGLYLLTGDHCPLCELDKHKAQMGECSEDWIKNAADGALRYCRENKLVPDVQ